MSFVEVPTTPYTDQKPGTSGLRKKVTVFQQEHYVANFAQSTFNALRNTPEGIPEVLVIGGDGRFFLAEAIQCILAVAAGNGVKRVWVGQHGLLSTPAVSTIIRRREGGFVAAGAFILTASHNPGGPTEDFGIKYNTEHGGPAPEKLTAAIYNETLKISTLRVSSETPAPVNLAKIATVQYSKGEVLNLDVGGMTVEVIDSLEDYCAYMAEIFDFTRLQHLISHPDFSAHIDCMHGASGPYARRIFHEILGIPMVNLLKSNTLPDFGGAHPDPNLTYAPDLVRAMGLTADGTPQPLPAPSKRINSLPAFGAAFDGDGDRNMILGTRFFVNPSDSLAVLAANADCVPFFKKAGGLKAVARSMPTSGAVDRVAAAKGLACFEVPTGWKFFGNLMDSKDVFDKADYNPLLCGEESFGTGSNHIREKDGIWAALFWLSIVSSRNLKPGYPLVTVQQIVEQHWAVYGRNYYSRYDYENVTAESAAAAMAAVERRRPAEVPALDGKACVTIDNFSYMDPVDGSVSAKQGVRVIFADDSRFVLRLSGTGSSGATIRLYLEQYMTAEAVATHLKAGSLPSAAVALDELIKTALEVSGIPEATGRDAPTVIT